MYDSMINMKIKLISVLLLLGLLWNSALGVSDGLFFKIYQCVDQCEEECDNTFGDNCRGEADEENCCYDTDVHLRAEKIEEVRVDNDILRISANTQFYILDEIFDRFLNVEKVINSHEMSRWRCDTRLNTSYSVAAIRTTVIRV